MILIVSETNDFGINWLKPVIWTFWITLGFYVLIIEAVYFDELSKVVSCLCSDITLITNPLYKEIKLLPELFNPTRTLTKHVWESTNCKVGFWASTFDMLLRIILAFFIFQTVTAFRKYYKG